MRYRSYRGSRRRSMSAPVRSFKKVINVIPASYGAGFNTTVVALGTDSLTSGQTSATDGGVPTGCRIKYIEFQFAAVNLAAVACVINTSIQYVMPAQTAIDPITAGGSNRRNQVLHLDMFASGDNQNVNRVYRIKIPKKFQRLSEGMSWTFSFRNSATVTAAIQVIYKFYQ